MGLDFVIKQSFGLSLHGIFIKLKVAKDFERTSGLLGNRGEILSFLTAHLSAGRWQLLNLESEIWNLESVSSPWMAAPYSQVYNILVFNIYEGWSSSFRRLGG